MGVFFPLSRYVVPPPSNALLRVSKTGVQEAIHPREVLLLGTLYTPPAPLALPRFWGLCRKFSENDPKSLNIPRKSPAACFWTSGVCLWNFLWVSKQSILASKTPREEFFWKVLPPKIFFWCFHFLQRVLSRHISPFPWENVFENYWPILAPRHSWHQDMSCWDYTFILPDRSHLRSETGSPQGASAPRRPEGSAVFCWKECGGVLWRNACCTRSLVRIFRWDFLMRFFQGFFGGKTAKRIRRKKSAPQNPHRPSQNPRKKNPHPKIQRKKIRTQKSAHKNPHHKIRMKNQHPHVRAKVPTTHDEWNKLQQTSAREGCQQRAPHGVLSVMLGDGHASSTQTTTSQSVGADNKKTQKIRTRKPVTRLWGTDNSKSIMIHEGRL